MLFKKIYYEDQWEVKRWGFIKFEEAGLGIIGYGVYIILLNKKTKKLKRLQFGRSFWNYRSQYEVADKVYEKTRINIDVENRRVSLAKR